MPRPPDVARGAYVLADADGGKPEVILMATGSEVYLCIDAYEKLKAEGIKARVVSMPSWDLFEQQDQSYREKFFRPTSRRASRSRWPRHWMGAIRGTEDASSACTLLEHPRR